TGQSNTAVGSFALASNSAGMFNTAVGDGALSFNNIGTDNTAVGMSALGFNHQGVDNTAIGSNTRPKSHGDDNSPDGSLGGSSITSGSDNIDIGNQGASIDSGRIRIGTGGTHTSFFVAGVRGVTTNLDNAVPVLIASNGQLGTVSSSRRFKEDIQDM